MEDLPENPECGPVSWREGMAGRVSHQKPSFCLNLMKTRKRWGYTSFPDLEMNLVGFTEDVPLA